LKNDDPEIFFNIKTIEKLGLGLSLGIILNDNEFNKGNEIVRQQKFILDKLKNKYCTLDGIDYVS
jgi:hypothetical protein